MIGLPPVLTEQNVLILGAGESFTKTILFLLGPLEPPAVGRNWQQPGCRCQEVPRTWDRRGWRPFHTTWADKKNPFSSYRSIWASPTVVVPAPVFCPTGTRNGTALSRSPVVSRTSSLSSWRVGSTRPKHRSRSPLAGKQRQASWLGEEMLLPVNNFEIKLLLPLEPRHSVWMELKTN